MNTKKEIIADQVIKESKELKKIKKPDLNELIRQDKEERLQNFGKAIEAAIRQYNCSLKVKTEIVDNEVKQGILFIAN